MTSTRLLLSIILLSFSACKNKKPTLEKLEGSDVIVSLNIEKIDTSIKKITFFGAGKFITLSYDTISDYSIIKYGYEGGGESVFSFRLYFANDTLDKYMYAEGGYHVKLRLEGREIFYGDQ